MPDKTRSQNPDLLFPDVMAERVDRTAAYWKSREGVLDELDRITIFVSHRCNLFCTYCNGPHVTTCSGDTERKRDMLHQDMTIETFGHLLEQILEHAHVRHIHFTGGEATLNKNLPTFVTMATEAGILTSLTTNGMADPALYRDLVARGMTEIRLSFDSHDAFQFEKLVQVKGAFLRVVDNIREIARMRDELHKNVFLVLNACVGTVNLAEIEETVRFFIGLEPDDIKLLVISEQKQLVTAEGSMEFTDRLRALLVEYPADRFILLRKKIDNLFNPEASGLRDEDAQRVMKHCFIPLTERTVDGTHYHPCSIYLRYYGTPIGPLTDSYEEQERKILDFVRGHDCRQDPICRDQCTNCCKVFNVRANQAIIADMPPLIVIEHGPTSDDILAWTEKIIGIIREGGPGSDQPFMLMKPHGQRWRTDILAFLAANGLEVTSIDRIEHWEDFSTAFYTFPLDPESIRAHLEMSRPFRSVEYGPTDILRFAVDPDPTTLERLKLEIRRLFPSKRFEVLVGGIRGTRRKITINAVHSPEPEDVWRENAILTSALHLQFVHH